MRYLLDTNVVSELRLAEPSPRVLDWIDAQERDDLCLSVITVEEIETGWLRKARVDAAQGERIGAWFQRAVLDAFVGRILPFDLAAARRTAALHVPDPMSYRDSQIAGIALAHDLTLVTRNARHFDRCGVRLLDPWSA